MIKILEKLSYRDLEILNIIQTLTKKHLQTVANIKLTTLNRIMKTLEDKKVVVVYGESEPTGGRKAVEYDVTQTFYVIWIDLSRTYVKLVLTELELYFLLILAYIQLVDSL